MGCCGQHRNAGLAATAPATGPAAAATPGAGLVWPPSMGAAPPHAAAFRQGGATMRLRYRDRSPVQVRGPVTGRAYEFSVAQAVQAVDVRDAQSLLRTRLFARVEG